jgi:hypothetical protein
MSERESKEKRDFTAEARRAQRVRKVRKAHRFALHWAETGEERGGGAYQPENMMKRREVSESGKQKEKNSPQRRGGHKERELEIKNLCELRVSAVKK